MNKVLLLSIIVCLPASRPATRKLLVISSGYYGRYSLTYAIKDAPIITDMLDRDLPDG